MATSWRRFVGFALTLSLASGCATNRSHNHQSEHHPAAAVMHVENPAHDCQIVANDRQITIRIPGKAHDFAAELQRWNAPRVLTKVTGEFNIEVRVSGAFRPGEKSTINGRRPYNGAGLLIVQDPQHHLSLQRGAVRLGNHTRHYANLELRDGSQILSHDFDLRDETAWLRLERRGGRIFAYACNDHDHWQAFQPIDVDFPETVEAGVVGINSAKKPFSCTFSDLSVYERRELKFH